MENYFLILSFPPRNPLNFSPLRRWPIIVLKQTGSIVVVGLFQCPHKRIGTSAAITSTISVTVSIQEPPTKSVTRPVVVLTSRSEQGRPITASIVVGETPSETGRPSSPVVVGISAEAS